MTDSTLLGAQLYGRLADLLAPPGSLDGTGNVVLVEPCGRDLDPADFGTDPDGAGAEAFADLVNPVPVPGATFVDSSRRLDDVAELVLLNAATDPAASIAAATLVNEARADLALMERGSETVGDLYHPAVADPRQWWDESTPWARVSFTVGSTAPPPPPPPPELVVLEPPPLLWTTCPTLDIATDPATRLAASGRMSLSRLAVQPELAERIRPHLVERTASLGRSGLARPALAAAVTEPAVSRSVRLRSAAPPVTAGSTDGALLTRMALRDRAAVQTTGVRVGEIVDTGPVAERRLRLRDLFVAHQDLVDRAPTASPEPPPSGFELSFSYRVVSIDRPWWHPELFAQPGWTMRGFEPGAVSTGTATANPGLLGAVTTRMLLVRGLTIRGSWSAADAGTAAAAQQEFGTLGLGPFSLTGDVGWDGTSLTRPGLQVVAWLAAVTPQFPRPA